MPAPALTLVLSSDEFAATYPGGAETLSRVLATPLPLKLPPPGRQLEFWRRLG